MARPVDFEVAVVPEAPDDLKIGIWDWWRTRRFVSPCLSRFPYACARGGGTGSGGGGKRLKPAYTERVDEREEWPRPSRPSSTCSNRSPISHGESASATMPHFRLLLAEAPRVAMMTRLRWMTLCSRCRVAVAHRPRRGQILCQRLRLLDAFRAG